VQAELQHLDDMPPFEGGRVLSDCEFSPDVQREMQGWEYRCVVVSQAEAGNRIEAYFQILRERGWTQGGTAGSAVWVLIPMGGDCAQIYGIVASDYPRGSTTTPTSEIVLDLILERRVRCGEERELL
jgi:hypothetical protein